MKRAVMVISDNGHEVTVGLPEQQALLDRIRELKDSRMEIRRDAGLKIDELKVKNSAMSIRLRQYARQAKTLVLWGCAAPVAAFLIGLIAGGFLSGWVQFLVRRFSS